MSVCLAENRPSNLGCLPLLDSAFAGMTDFLSDITPADAGVGLH